MSKFICLTITLFTYKNNYAIKLIIMSKQMISYLGYLKMISLKFSISYYRLQIMRGRTFLILCLKKYFLQGEDFLHCPMCRIVKFSFYFYIVFPTLYCLFDVQSITCQQAHMIPQNSPQNLNSFIKSSSMSPCSKLDLSSFSWLKYHNWLTEMLLFSQSWKQYYCLLPYHSHPS